MEERRKNHAMAATVEKAILLKDTVSVHQAAIYLASGGVPLDVTGRVLTTPYRRGMVRSGVSDEAYTRLPATPLPATPASAPAAPAARTAAPTPAAPAAPVPAPAAAAPVAPASAAPDAAPAPAPAAQAAAPALPLPLREAEPEIVTVPLMVPGTPPAVASSWRDIIHSAGPTFR
jgi:pyruvate/2-oxoglutarate dehydrogenase complex dihydrolipoamide acyltransferase (E2) component